MLRKTRIALQNIFIQYSMRYSDVKNKITNDSQENGKQLSKELAYQKTNQSAINMLKSFKTLDFLEKGEELRLVPVAPGNVNLATNLNRKSQLDQPSYGR
jgi:hypothetical protein